MVTMSMRDIQIIMTIVTFAVGLITFATGVVILIKNTMGKEVKAIAAQTAQLAQKGLAEEVAGLVGNASSLLNALDGMVHTAQGIGLFLTVIGVIILLTSFWLVFQIH